MTAETSLYAAVDALIDTAGVREVIIQIEGSQETLYQGMKSTSRNLLPNAKTSFTRLSPVRAMCWTLGGCGFAVEEFLLIRKALI